jgi:hypothetical protein
VDELEELIRVRFSCPRTLTTLTPRSEQWLTEILSRPQSTYDFGEYQFLLSGRFEESIIFLPSALRFCSRDRVAGRELIDAVVAFVTSFDSEIKSCELNQQVEKCLEEVFFRWLDNFTGESVHKPTGEFWVSRCIVESSSRDHFLGKLIESHRRLESTHLVDGIFDQWSRATGPNSAAHFLDLAFTLRIEVAEPTAVHRYGPAIQMAQNQNLLSGLWKLAEPTIANRCPVEYYEAIAELCWD